MPEFYSTSAAADVSSNSDEDYIASVVQSSKPQPAPSRRLESLPIEEITESLKTRIYVSERGSPEFHREVNSDIGFCSFCRYETPDRESLRAHYSSHEEIASFKQAAAKEMRKLEGLIERQRQVEDSMVRLEFERKTLAAEIADFDRAGLKSRQSQLSQIISLGI